MLAAEPCVNGITFFVTKTYNLFGKLKVKCVVNRGGKGGRGAKKSTHDAPERYTSLQKTHGILTRE